MAKSLPNEKELYEQIKKEQITIAPEIWNLLYNRIGDDISAINLLTQFYLIGRTTIPSWDAHKILFYTRHIKEIVNQVTLVEKDEFLFPEFVDNIPLHPVLREMFTHYIGNDVYMINLIVENALDPMAPEPVSLENTQKILEHARSIKDFMNRLLEATSSA